MFVFCTKANICTTSVQVNQSVMDAVMNEKRISENGMTDTDTSTEPLVQGVGGRHKELPQSEEGGGYLDVYTKNAPAVLAKIFNDIALSDFNLAKLPPFLLDIAETVGTDNFFKVWGILSKAATESYIGHSRVYVPSAGKIVKIIRDKYIVHLDGEKKSPSEIKVLIEKHLCEDISVVHINRIIKRNKLQE